MNRFASSRRHWTIAILGSIAFHAAILFVPMGVPDQIERTTSILQVALSFSGSAADIAAPRAAVSNSMPKAGKIGAPAAASTPDTVPEAVEMSAATAEAMVTPGVEGAQIDANTSEDTLMPAEVSRSISIGTPIAEPAHAQKPPATKASHDFSKSFNESPAALARIVTQAISRSINAEASPPIADTLAQTPPLPPPLPPPTPSLASSTAQPEEPKTVHFAAPMPRNYFRNALNLFTQTKETFVIAAAVPSSASQELAAISLTDSTLPETSSPPTENTQRETDVALGQAPQDNTQSLTSEPQRASAQAPERASISPPTRASIEASSSPNQTESVSSAPPQNYFPSREIFIAKSMMVKRNTAQAATPSASIGAGAPSDAKMNKGGNAGGEGYGDFSLSPEQLRGEQRAARELNPPLRFSGSGSVSESSSMDPSNGAKNLQKLVDRIAGTEQPDETASQALATSLEPSSFEQGSSIAQSVPRAGASTAMVGVPVLSEAPVPDVMLAPVSSTELSASPTTPIAPTTPSTASNPASSHRPASAPQLPAPLVASADGLTIEASTASNNVLQYDSAEMLASRVLAELSVRKLYPAAALRRKTEGKVTLILSVEKNGQLASAVIQTRSGSSILDEAALSLARSIFPLEIHLASPVSLVVPIEYRIPK